MVGFGVYDWNGDSLYREGSAPEEIRLPELAEEIRRIDGQLRLLRPIGSRMPSSPAGGTGTIPLDARIVATTNRNLQEQVNEGAFREDLFYRLNVIPLEVPPLRERPEDMGRVAIVEALHRHEGHRQKAADELGITRRTLLNKINDYELDTSMWERRATR